MLGNALERRLVAPLDMDVIMEDMDVAPQPTSRFSWNVKIALGFCATFVLAGTAAAAALLSRSSGSEDTTCPVNNTTGEVVLSRGTDTFYYNASTGDFPSPNMTQVAVLPCYMLLCASRLAVAQTQAFFTKTSVFVDEACNNPNLNLSGACTYFTRKRNYTIPECDKPPTDRSCETFANELLKAEAIRRCRHGIFGMRGRMVYSENDTINGKPVDADSSQSGEMTSDVWELYVTDKNPELINAIKKH